MWRNKLLLLISATLVSLAIGQESAQKADFPSEPTAPTARLGRLVVGRGVKLLSGEAEKNIGGEVRDGLTDHSETYQADQQGSTVWYKAAESKLQRLNPSVHCGDDAMALRVQGSRVPNFMVDRGEDGLLPVLQMPANCGLSVKRARRDVLLTANYKGCHVMQEGEAYILTLRLWGAPVSISCPVATSAHETVAPTTTASTETPMAPIIASDAQKPFSPYQINPFDRVPHWYPYYPYGYQWARPTRTPTVAPTTTASMDTSTAPVPVSDAQKPFSPYDQINPFDRVPHWYPYYQYGYPLAHPTRTPTVAPTTTASMDTSTAPVPVSDAQKPFSPYDQINPFDRVPHWYPYYQYGYPLARPTRTPTVAPTTTASMDTSTAPVPASDAQKPFSPYDQIYPFDRVPHWYPYYPYGYPLARPTRTPTVAPTTTASMDTSTAPVPASDAQKPFSPYDQIYPFDRVPHWYPYYPYGYPWARPTRTPTVAPTTTASMDTSTAPVPASDVQKPFSPYHLYTFDNVPHWHPYYQDGYPWPHPTSTPTASTSTVTAPTLPARDSQEPGSHFDQLYPFGYVPHWNPGYARVCSTSTPIVAPATVAGMDATAPSVPANDPQDPSFPFAKMYPFGHFPYKHWHPHF
ncbi:mucin-2-like [Pygocentrus nattereri]|uniref:Zona pellucida sperm-binding protein 1/4 Ig-like domain-containing protein n=1 Tax=Pygocentrus nattereri TaxID=42514 RepID=A0AAR2J3I8_PYGNA|nr:mucin-2-like [Pygocentrus nattereri]